MNAANRTPLAWSLLTHDKRRMLVSLAGVAFSVLLMFVETGFLYGIYDSQTLLLSHLRADLLIEHPLRETIIPPRPFPRQRLYRALSVPGVANVCPLYLNMLGAWRDPAANTGFVTVLGINPDDSALQLAGWEKYRGALHQPHTAIADRRSRPVVGQLTPGLEGELGGRRLRLVGDFELGPDFVVDGLLVMSDRTFAAYFPDRAGRPDFEHIELGLIRARPGVDVDDLRRRIAAVLPDDVRVVTRSQAVATEKRFWGTAQPIGLIFGLGAAVGFLIGVAICYQILFNEINDHQAEFATLKALGYPNRHLVGVVLGEALYLSLIAFLPALAASGLTYACLQGMTGITMRLTTARTATVFLLTVGMCLFSAGLAVRKVLQGDPAEMF